jgi:hypothetical protein
MKKTLRILLPMLILVTAACNKQIDDVKPLTKIDEAGELASLAGIVETTAGSYLLLSKSGFANYDVPLQDLGESRGNNVTLQNWGPANQNTDAFFFQNNNSPTLGNSAGFYRGAYQIIVSVNTTLEGIATFQASSFASLTNNDQNRLLYAKGENMFLRAFTYFNLVRVYGKPYYQNAGSSLSIPLKKTSNINDAPAPASVKDVYTFIVTELQTAAQLMKAPVATPPTNAFASTGAAWALLSRVYLYMGGSIASPDPGSNQLAAAYADSVISQTGGKYALSQGSAYQQLFGDDQLGALGRAKFAANKEIIFACDNSAGGSSIGQLYHYDATYRVGATFLPSSDLRQLFLPADLRGTFFKLNTHDNHVETTKWLCLNLAWLTYAPNIFFRLGEVYLNRAEAYAKLNNTAMARADLKAIHTRAGLPASDVDNLADGDVITAVLKERRMELAFEGHNSFDYFRNGLPMTRTAADNNGTAMTVQPDDPKVVFTIPNN